MNRNVATLVAIAVSLGAHGCATTASTTSADAAPVSQPSSPSAARAEDAKSRLDALFERYFEETL
jgi:hypothetical protein